VLDEWMAGRNFNLAKTYLNPSFTEYQHLSRFNLHTLMVFSKKYCILTKKFVPEVQETSLKTAFNN
jgi:hypothetical protein